MDDQTPKDDILGRRKRLGEYLLEEGLIEEDQLKAALDDQQVRSQHLGRLLIDKKLVSDVQLARTLALQHHLPFVRLKQKVIPPEAINLVPPKLARLHGLVPVEMTPEALLLATAYPSRFYEMEKDIRFVVQMKIKAVVAPEDDISWALATYYPRPKGQEEDEASEDVLLKDVEILDQEEIKEESVEDIEKIADLPPVVRFTNSIFAEGILMGASDLHIEPQKDQVLIRFRIDGLMRPIMRTIRENHLPLVSRIKILSGLDISIRRIPQDGKAQIRYSGKVFDLRVSTLPTFYGEKVTIRILDPAVTKLTPKDIGLSPVNLDQLLEGITHPEGLIVVTGPTGSGKTSTLYACLNQLNTPEVNIITVEDPVEFDVAGINQVQISSKAGVTFGAALRSILRQDPDIVMVGEIRDAETAGISLQAAQTGHLVLSTLHTNDTPSALVRLMDLSIEPYLISSSLILAVGQRLVRRICSNCKAPASLDPALLDHIQPFMEARDPVFFAGKGCEQCNHTGYKGRLGVFELLVMTPALKKAVAKDFDLPAYRSLARREGYRAMFEDGLTKALQGLTTMDEVLRVTSIPGEDEPAPGPPPETAAIPAAPRPPEAIPDNTAAWDPDQTPAFLEEARPTRRSTQGTVLVVDDNTDILTVLQRALAQENMDVLTALNGREGLKLAREHRPALIITDYKMPVMDGFEFIKRLKTDPILEAIPVIMLTAKSDVDAEVTVLEAGADDYVVKPVDRRRFVARVKRLLNKGTSSAATPPDPMDPLFK